MGFKLYVAVRDNCPYVGANRWVFLTLADLASDANQRVDYGRGWRVSKLAYYAGVYERTWQRACAKMEADGYLSTERRYRQHKQEPNHYQLHIPQDWFGPDKSDDKPKPAKPRKPAKPAKPAPEATSPSQPAMPADVADPAEIAAAEPTLPPPVSLAGYVDAPALWRPMLTLLGADMSPQMLRTVYDGARLYRPQSCSLDADAPHILVCRNLTAWRLASTAHGMARLGRVIAHLRIPIHILPIPPQAAVIAPTETSDVAPSSA